VPERYPPEDPREWLNRAKSNLLLARTQGTGIYLEDLCFNAQQAVEKAIKALLIQRAVVFPYVHDIAQLLTQVEQGGLTIPLSVKEGERLTRFAVFTRYPGVASPVRPEELTEAVRIAEEVIQWVEGLMSREETDKEQEL
jgi:HEPN domain-containing protein